MKLRCLLTRFWLVHEQTLVQSFLRLVSLIPNDGIQWRFLIRYVDSLDLDNFNTESVQDIANQLEITFVSFVGNLISLSMIEGSSGKAKRAEPNEFIGLGSVSLIKDVAAVANVSLQTRWASSLTDILLPVRL
jgi:surface protein